jgi:hypothetical protein
MSENVPVWREALTNRDHELYPVAWTVFMERMNAEVANERLADLKEQAIPLLSAIIEDEYLHTEEAPGDGKAPINAIKLLGDWQVSDALPKLLDILAENPQTKSIYTPTVNALSNFGDGILDDVLNWVEDKPELRRKAAAVLSRIGIGNEKAYETIASWIVPSEYDMAYFANCLIDINSDEAASTLRKLSQDREFEREERNVLKSKSKDARTRQKEQEKTAVVEA